MKLHFQKALLPDGWQDDVVIGIEDRTIRSIDVGVTGPPGQARAVAGFAIPGMTNVHSHAFQHAFAGLSEYRTSQHDSFWTWRKRMYEFLERITPEEMHRIGRRLYAQMLAAGYTTVGEFHYLHHQPDGTPYGNVNEMADALIQAAIDVGMNICMLPVYYQRGGFDDSPLSGGQKRFGSSRDLFLKMLEKLKSDWSSHPQVRPGFALHSLRAVTVPAGQAMVSDVEQILPGCPIHIHVAEQTSEVDDCLAASGKRPVQLLLDSFDVNHRWCLIHATHMDDDECRRVAASGATIGVCPTTEANLGDGIFRGEAWLKAGGKLAIGSDSHISVDACEELRMLEYSQRLSLRRRAILCTDDQSCGSLLWHWASRGGAAVTGFGSPELRVGSIANLCLIDPRLPDHVSIDRLLDLSVFHSTSSVRPVTAFSVNEKVTT